MIKVAILGDDLERLKNIENALKEYSLSKDNISFSISPFKFGYELIEACQRCIFSLYVLLDSCSTEHGIDLGVSIKRYDHDALIIYLSEKTNLKQNLSVQHTVRYEECGIDKHKFYNLLTLILGNYIEEEPVFTIKSKQGVEQVRFSEIICCEQRGHNVIFNLLGGAELESVALRTSAYDYLLPIIQNNHFYQPHVSYVINFRYVEKMKKNEIIMRGGKIIPIVKKLSKEARSAYNSYLAQSSLEKIY